MKRLVLSGALLLCAAPLMAQTPVTTSITVTTANQRKFTGFGASLRNYTNPAWSATPEGQAARPYLMNAVFRDLKMNTVRLWVGAEPSNVHPDDAPEPDGIPPVSRLKSRFYSEFVASRALDELRARGVDTLLMAPQFDNNSNPSATNLDSFMGKLTTLIYELKRDYGVTIHTTGINNEPDGWTSATCVSAVKLLRTKLNAYGLQSVQIIAPEWSGVSQPILDRFAALQADSVAWAALGGLGSHSYGNNTIPETNAYINSAPDKRYWQTESADPESPDSPTNAPIAAKTAARIMGDFNHSVNTWMYFHGVLTKNFNDSTAGVTIGIYDPNLKQARLHLKHAYMKQLMQTFERGGTFYRCTNPERYAYQNPALFMNYNAKGAFYAAACKNPDGSWGIGVVNTTSLPANSSGDNWKPAATFNFKLDMSALSGTGSLSFQAFRSNASATMQPLGTITLSNGVGTIPNVAPLDLITLRSAPSALTAGVKGEYFNGRDLNTLIQTRTDSQIGFNWGTGAPASSVNTNSFSVRWTGKIKAIETGVYTIRTLTDDGVRLWLGDTGSPNSAIHQWRTGGNQSYETTISLSAGQILPFKMEYFDADSDAKAYLQWKRPGSTSLVTIPAA